MSHGDAYWEGVGQRHHAKQAARTAAKEVEQRLQRQINELARRIEVLTAQAERIGRHEWKDDDGTS